MSNVAVIEVLIQELNNCLEKLIDKLGRISIGTTTQFPYGWRKSAKGRTVWRIVEEAINQNLEKYYKEFGLVEIIPSDSEVSVYDAMLRFPESDKRVYVNFKTSVSGGRTNKDDISKAEGLRDFFTEDVNRDLFIITFEIEFDNDMRINLSKFYVMPIMWLPDIYVNPSNNGNLQSSQYKNIDTAVKRTNEEFFEELGKEIAVARLKRGNKLRQND